MNHCHPFDNVYKIKKFTNAQNNGLITHFKKKESKKQTTKKIKKTDLLNYFYI